MTSLYVLCDYMEQNNLHIVLLGNVKCSFDRFG